MDVQSVVSLAKKHIGMLFADENVTNLGLEEVTFNEQDKVWMVTLGFSRPWDKPVDVTEANPLGIIAQMQQGSQRYNRRDYKTIRVQDEDGKILSVTSREFE
ncbi:MAG: hypothetical protein ABTQ34_01850 [Bdellovibrionales bacterium]